MATPNPSNPPSLDEQMIAALRRMDQHAAAAQAVDRRGWTRRQWIEDAERLMADLDGSVSSLLNGHVQALLAEVRDLRDGIGGLAAQYENFKHHDTLHLVALDLRRVLALTDRPR